MKGEVKGTATSKMLGNTDLTDYDILCAANPRYRVLDDPEGSIIRKYTDYVSLFLISPAFITDSGSSKRESVTRILFSG
jgi:hypothetical protein